MKLKYTLHKILNWEYWPQWLVYLPITPVYIYYALKAKQFYFNVAANPGLENGGYILESKYTIYQQLPFELQPKTIFVNKSISFENLYSLIETKNISFPFVCKPDIGGKGRGVKFIHNKEELRQYHVLCPINYLIQEKINYTNEVGIFYAKHPLKEQGIITGIVEKEAMTVVGNGKNTLRELIELIPRYYFQRNFLFEKHQQILNKVLSANETFVLSTIGNHARGSLFRDSTHKSNDQLTKLINDISKTIDGFYFGRLDIMFDNWNDFYAGEKFLIVELNGSGSEPTHIYDPKKNIVEAWRIIIHHWKLMYEIANYNLKKKIIKVSAKQIRVLEKEAKKIEKKLTIL